MIFNSAVFLLFLPIVFILYWSLSRQPIKYQNALLLLASYVFYGWWDYRFLSLIAFSTAVDYVLGLKIEAASEKKTKRLYLMGSIFVNLGLLGFFKYYNFFVSSLTDSLSAMGLTFDTWTLKIILPVGISFYTFQTLSYSIDIFKGKIKPTKDFLSFAVFVSFFPQLVAGPIERASHLLPQFLKARKFSLENATTGLTLITYGFFKKLVIADRLAIYVNSVFDDIEGANNLSLLIGMIFFSFQIYADFSGYSLIARGISKLLGFDLMTNFRRPYLAVNISDFWRRWHISLSTWFRDYVYIPLGGNRVSTVRNYTNLLIVFLVSGLWHGANWTFVIWGALHGLFQVIYLNYTRLFPAKASPSWMAKWANVLLVYVVVTFAWIFFRAESLSDAFFYLETFAQWDWSFNLVQISAEKGPLNLVLSFFAIGLLLLSYRLPEDFILKKQSHYLAFNVVAIFTIILIGINGKAQFIYFQF